MLTENLVPSSRVALAHIDARSQIPISSDLNRQKQSAVFLLYQTALSRHFHYDSN